MRSDTKTRSARPRGRPRAYDADAALGAARDAFWAAGYSATSLDDLATATGMNRPSLYAAFGNKQALYLKALAQLGGNMEQQVGAVLGAPLPLAEALRRFYLNALTLYLSGQEGPRGCFIICTTTAEAHAEPEIREFLGQTLRHLDDALVARFRAAVEQGELPAHADADTLGRVAASLLHSLAVRARAGQSRASLRRLVDGGVKVLTAALD
jgi:AcrR family transcriptional regulator